MRPRRLVAPLIVGLAFHAQTSRAQGLRLRVDPATLERIWTAVPAPSPSAGIAGRSTVARAEQNPLPSSDWAAVSGLARDRLVTVYLRDQSAVTGAIRDVGAASISVVSSDRAVRTISTSDIARVSIVAIRRSTKSLLIGYAVGAVAGIYGLELLDKHAFNDKWGSGGTVLIGTLVGGSAGAAISSAAFKRQTEIVIYESAATRP